jgi:hypothetical protein
VVGRIRCSKSRGLTITCSGVVARWRSPTRSRRDRGRRRPRSSGRACRGRPSAASAYSGALGSARHARGRARPGRASGARARTRPSAGGGRARRTRPAGGGRGCADLGDRALSSLLAGGVLRRHQADEGHELLRRLEAAEVADLGDDPERGQRVHAAQAAQAGDERRPRPLRGRLGDRPLERRDAGVDEVDRVQVGVERQLRGGVLEALLREPLRMWLYRAHPGNPRQMRRRRPLSTGNRTPPPAGLRLHPV